MRVGLLLVALLAAPLSLVAQTTVRDVVERFDAAQAKADTFQAPFTLTIRRALLKTPTVTKGTLYLKGSDFAHFAFSPPEDLILHLTPKLLVSFNPHTGEGEQLKIGIIRNANRKFLGLGQKLSYLGDYFQIALTPDPQMPAAHHLTLSPRSFSMKRRFQMIHIWVDRDSWLPRQVQWIERGGDSWNLELGPMAVNQALPPSVNGFKVPANTRLQEGFSFFASSSRKK